MKDQLCQNYTLVEKAQSTAGSTAAKVSLCLMLGPVATKMVLLQTSCICQWGICLYCLSRRANCKPVLIFRNVDLAKRLKLFIQFLNECCCYFVS